MPTSKSLPLAAAMMWLIKMAWIGSDPVTIAGDFWLATRLPVRILLQGVARSPSLLFHPPTPATMLQGCLLSIVPLSILYGAFLFFNAIQLTQARLIACWRVGCWWRQVLAGGEAAAAAGM